MSGSTPSNPTKMPSIPTGPTSSQKPSKSKVMNPMPSAKPTQPSGRPSGTSTVSPQSQSQTVSGGPKR